MTLAKDDEHFFCLRASPARMDQLWADGWRHFGVIFLRYRTSEHGGRRYSVLPLRIDLECFGLRRSQKRILAKNRDLRVLLRPSSIDPEKEAVFERHRHRFNENVPTSLFNFMSPDPTATPCPNLELCVYHGDKLLGATFLDIGATATSAVYAFFDPAVARRSLGILMMLHSIQFSMERGCRYYYPGYAYREPFTYDYKKHFTGLECLNWDNGWKPFDAALDAAPANVKGVLP